MPAAVSAFQPTLLNFVLPSSEIEATAKVAIEAHKKVEDELAAKGGDQWTTADIDKLIEAGMEFEFLNSSCTFPMYTSTDKETRDVSAKAENLLDEYSIQSGMREDMFKAFSAFSDRVKKGEVQLDPEYKRFIEFELRDYRRNGLGLPADKRERLGAVKKRLSELGTEFSKALNEDNTKEAFTRDELAGMPEDYIDALEKTGDGRYYVTLKYPDLLPLMRKCSVEATRKRMDFLKGRMCQEENTPRFEEALELRKELAGLLGFGTYADYALEVRMAKKKENALEFLTDLRAKLVPYAKKELQVLLNLKNQDSGANQDGVINGWDLMYYHTILLDTEYKLDEDKIKEYFPLDKVTDGMFEIYQQLLGLRFEKIGADDERAIKLYHPDCMHYAVYDASTGGFMGQFILDMHPREGKYGHAAVFGLQRAGMRADGSYVRPTCAMLCNFTKPTSDKPSLLKHSEVTTYFHEFGHVMHNICSEAKVHRFACTRVERDFVEAPSQMLENWCFAPESLKMMSGHYKTGEPVPEEMVESIIKAKNCDTGLLNLRQAFFGTFDMTCHTAKEKVNTEALWAKLRDEVSLIPQQPGCNPAASFGHLMGGYEAGYYGYLWSEVYSADLFSVFEATGVMNEENGLKYRRHILSPGGSQDGMDMVVGFLGRQPTQDAFLRHIGVA